MSPDMTEQLRVRVLAGGGMQGHLLVSSKNLEARDEVS